MVFFEGDAADVTEVSRSEACPEGTQDVILRPGVFLRFRAATKAEIEALSRWANGEGRELLRNQLAAQNRAGARAWLLLRLAGSCTVGISAGFERDERVKGLASVMGLSPSAPLAVILAPLFTLPNVAADVEKAIGVPLAPIVEDIEKRRAMH